MGEKTLCQNSVSQSSSYTKCGSISPVMTEIDTILAGSSATARNQNEDIECRSFKSYTDEMMAVNDLSSSDELEDSLDNKIKLLFDVPFNNDMSLLEEDTNKYASCHVDKKLLHLPPLKHPSNTSCLWGLCCFPLFFFPPSGHLSCWKNREKGTTEAKFKSTLVIFLVECS
ncbi:hypothetical protein I3842_02G029400 [Carya illinoinensis]|uniref:Uncharacterized protein n=1 Tax=Carya illinoinensis TaxID=32201 RepID=A0A922FN36_CARIL|nr:hypothetical protein I3842_02G029400 [Carya illinoinensis]